MVAPSLVQISRRMCIKTVKRIRDIGLAPYELIRPVLQKIENPEQLHELELNSPHLLDHDAELWIEFIKRDIPFWSEITLPENPESWYKLYCSLRAQVAKEVAEDAERMRRALHGLDKKKAKHGAKFVDAEKLRLPQEKPTSIQKYAHHDRIMGGITPTFVLNNGETRGNAWENTAKWKFEKPKLPSRTPKKSALPVVKRNQRLCIPTHQLSHRASPVTKAPKSLIADYRPNLNRPAPKSALQPTALRRPSIPSRPTSQSAKSSSSTIPTTSQPKTSNTTMRPGQTTKPAPLSRPYPTAAQPRRTSLANTPSAKAKQPAQSSSSQNPSSRPTDQKRRAEPDSPMVAKPKRLRV